MVFERVIYKQRSFIEDQTGQEYFKIQQEKMKIVMEQTENLKNQGFEIDKIGSQKSPLIKQEFEINKNDIIELNLTSE